MPSTEEGVTVTGKVKEKAAHLAVRQDDEMNSEQMDKQGGGVQIGPNLRILIGQLVGEDKPRGWASTTSVQDSHPTLKPPIDSMVDLTFLFVIDDMVCDVLLLSPPVPHGPPLSTNIRLSSLPSHPIIPGVAS